MKIKGIEMENYGIFVRNAVSVEKYSCKFADLNPVEIMLVSVNDNDEKVAEYDIFCENRKVAAKVLKRIKEDLKDGFFDVEFKNYSEFILNSVAGNYVRIFVVAPDQDTKFLKVKTGTNLPF